MQQTSKLLCAKHLVQKLAGSIAGSNCANVGHIGSLQLQKNLDC